MKMKIKRPKLFFAIILMCILIALLVILALFVNQLSQGFPSGESAAAAETQAAIQKKIVYISNNLEDPDEYDQVIKIRNYFETNGNLQFIILDSNGMLPLQTNHIDSLDAKTVNLLLIYPIDSKNIYEKLKSSTIPAIYCNMQSPQQNGISIGFSDENGAQLVSQHVFASVYPDSNICIIGKEKRDSLYQKTLAALQKVKDKNGNRQAISSYFTNGIEISDIKRMMPDLMDNQSVIILDPMNASFILQYLKSNAFSGDTIVVSQDEKMISKLLEGKLDAIVYREKDLFAKTVYKTALEVLNGSPLSASIDCYQGLLIIDNINQYLESKKNSTY